MLCQMLSDWQKVLCLSFRAHHRNIVPNQTLKGTETEVGRNGNMLALSGVNSRAFSEPPHVIIHRFLFSMNTFQKDPSPSLPAKPVSAAPAKLNPVKANDAQAVFFPEWHSSLELEPFDNTQKVRFERAIIAFLG